MLFQFTIGAPAEDILGTDKFVHDNTFNIWFIGRRTKQAYCICSYPIEYVIIYMYMLKLWMFELMIHVSLHRNSRL